MKRRLLYFVLSIICFVCCILIVGFFSQSQFIRGFIGDVIIILLIYFFLKIFIDISPLKLVVFTLILAFIIEFMQYLKLISLLGLEHSALARLIIGSVFDPMDLFAYTIGAVIVYYIDARLLKSLVTKLK